jgi:hypothetical protein
VTKVKAFWISLTLLGLLGLCALPACTRAPATSRDPVSAANAFFATIETGDPHAAYDSAAFGFQATQSFDGFVSNARTLGLVGGKPPVWTTKNLAADQAQLDGTMAASDGHQVNVSVTMTPDGGAWKLFSLKTANGIADSEDHFSVVGKETGFNDVYHQPMPGPAKLDALVQKTLADFNGAVQAGNFHDFYGTLAQQWKDGQRSTGQAADGITETILNRHFQAFIERKVNIGAITGLKPVYDIPPQIDEDGLLQLKGHFPTRPYQLNFELQYIYELPEWKLFGIDVTLTQ